MPTRTVELRGKRIEITDEKRARVLAEMPEIGWIKTFACVVW